VPQQECKIKKECIPGVEPVKAAPTKLNTQDTESYPNPLLDVPDTLDNLVLCSQDRENQPLEFHAARSSFLQRLDCSDVDPEAGVIRLVLGVRVDLLLDPHNCALVPVDIICIRVGQTGCSVAVAGKPLVVAIVLLAIPSRGDIGVDVGARAVG
jgi:hypothetical protein